jgi:hypothetical protein
MVKRCSLRGVVDGGELLWPGEPTPASGGVCCVREKARRKEGKEKGEALRWRL